VLPRRGEVLLIQFPQAVMMRKFLPREIVKTVLLLVSLLLAKASSGKIVWNVNNVHSHDGAHRRLEWLWMRIFVGLCDGIIHMSQESRRQVEAAFPAAANRPSAIVPHPNYNAAFPYIGDGARGRAIAGAQPGEKIILAFGMLRRYKGHEGLIKAFRATGLANARLVVCGRPFDNETLAAIAACGGGDPRVSLVMRSVDDQEAADLFAAATLLCLPATRILNSGSAILSLTQGRPVLAPRMGSLPEVAEAVGGNYMRLYDGPFGPGVLRDGLEWAVANAGQQKPDLSAWDCDAVARGHLAVLQQWRRNGVQ
jgi:beta-1,4-mannosyltransferase